MSTPDPDLSNTAKKAATGTVVVLAVLFAIFCVAPMLFCGLGNLFSRG
jgi:hypothetical protein